MRYFHPTATKYYVQSGVRRYNTVHMLMRDKDNVIIYIMFSGGAGQQCCYDADGILMVGSRSGRSVNCIAPVDMSSFYQHIQHDVIPFNHLLLLCFSCMRYYERKASDNGEGYQPILPG